MLGNDERAENDGAGGFGSRHVGTVASPAVTYTAVVFDLGGVVMPSPIETFRDYEARVGLPHRFISEVILSGDDNAWSRLERGELTMDEFADEFEAECAMAGGTVVVADLFAEIGGGVGSAARDADGDPAHPRRGPADGGAHEQLAGERRRARDRRALRPSWPTCST